MLILKSDLSIFCIKYAESTLPESMVFLGGNKNKSLPISFAVYLIKSGDRNILVDAGCYTMPGFKMRKFYSSAFVLRTVDVSADEITDVIITHSHQDHIEAVKYFKNAVIHITKKKYEDGRAFIPDNFKVNLFENEYTISPIIKILECGGHFKGSSIVEIQTDDLIHIFAGDECYTNANIEKGICTGTCYNKDNAIRFIEKYSNKKYSVHTCHDISLKTERIL